MSEARTIVVKFRVTAEERDRIDAAARSAGMTASDWIRRAVLPATTDRAEPVRIGKVAHGQVNARPIDSGPTRPKNEHVAARMVRAGSAMKAYEERQAEILKDCRHPTAFRLGNICGKCNREVTK